jgi:uncharacterized membrane protein YfcA
MYGAITLAALIAGLMIGVTGIGGVVVVPALTEFAAMPVERAIATSLFGFVLPGGLAAFMHLRRVRLDARPMLVGCVAAGLGAAIGALTLGWLPAAAVRLFIALLCVVSGVHALVPKRASGKLLPSTRWLAALGLAVGYASAISGTGGPVTAIPILLALNTQVAQAIAFGLAVQVPIIIVATAVNAAAARVDYGVGIAIALFVTVGTYAGARLSARLSTRGITVAVALTLIAVGAWYGYATLAARA